VQAVKQLGFSDDERRAILHDNAAALLKDG
jgi:predicted TIM-barrel fold metal-dependent hydrolase